MKVVIFALVAVLSGVASAQSATVRATHNHPTAIVQPGEVVRLTYTVSWTGAVSAARIAGDAVATPDAGVAGAPSSAYAPSALLNIGSAVLGSIRGVELQSQPPALWGLPIPFSASPLQLFSYDWTAPSAPGIIAFNWEPRSDLPNAQFYLTLTAFGPTSLPTTYLGTSLTVVPAPHAAFVLLAGLGTMTAARRRR